MNIGVRVIYLVPMRIIDLIFESVWTISSPGPAFQKTNCYPEHYRGWHSLSLVPMQRIPHSGTFRTQSQLHEKPVPA
jgi:hypothetical protein